MSTLTGKLIRVDQVDVPPEYEREESLTSEDDPLHKSIQAHGVLDPINVLALSNGRYGLIKGGRRLVISQALGLTTIPAIVDVLPAGVDAKAYQNRLRFILDEHAQDLFPSQRAAVITQLMSMFGMKQKDVAEYLDVDAGTVTNWMRIRDYAPEIVKAIDTGEIDLHKARAFDGMKMEAQPAAFRRLRKDFRTLSGDKVRQLARTKFRSEFEGKAKKPEAAAKRRRRPRLSRSEKELLARDLSLKEIELADGKEELQRLNREITLATPVIRGILRNDELVAMLPREVKPEFERFAECYV